MRLILSFLVLAVLALPAGALGQDNSAIDEYIESVPGAGGDEPSRQGGGSDGEGRSLPGASAEALGAEGEAGAAAADLAQATAPDAPAGGGGDDSGSGRDGAAGQDATAGEGQQASIGDAAATADVPEADDGVGLWLPILLGVTLLGAIGLVAVRRVRANRADGA